MDTSKPMSAAVEEAAKHNHGKDVASEKDVERGLSKATLSRTQSQTTLTPEKPDDIDGDSGPSSASDGGRAGWLMILGGWCGVFCTLGLLNCGGVFEDYYATGPLRAYGASSASWIVSVQAWACNFSGIAFGRLYDRHGPRRIVLVGALFYVFGLMMLSLGSRYWHFFLAQSLCVGVASGAIFSCCVAAAATWFTTRRASAYGVMLSGSGIGGAVIPVVMTKMIDQVGFPWAVRTVAFISLPLLTVTVFTVKARTPPTPKQLSFKDYLKGFRQTPYALIILASFFYYWGIYLPFNYINLQAKAVGISPKLVPYLLSIINALSVIGRIGPGIIADRVGRFNTTIVLVALASLFTLALWIPGTSQASLITYAVLFGLASGGFISLSPALIAHVSDLSQIGSRTGAAYAVQSFATLTGSPIAGSISAAMGGRYLGLQLFCGLALAASALALAASRAVLGGFSLRTRL